MPSLSGLFYLMIVVSLTSAHFVLGEEKSSPCRRFEPTWQVNWENQEALGNESFNITDVMEFVGFLWNANSWMEMFGMTCVQHAPLLSQINISDYEATIVYNFCENIVSSLRDGDEWNFGACCRNGFEELFPTSNISTNFIYILDVCEIQEKCQELGCELEDMFQHIIDCYLIRNHSEYLIISLVERWSLPFLDILDWLGPSAFSGDAFALCSSLRRVSGMKLAVIINETKNISAYFLAELLEYLKLSSFCQRQPIRYNYMINLTLGLYYTNGRIGFCEDLSTAHEQRDFHSLSLFFLDHFPVVIGDKDWCQEILSVITYFTRFESDPALCTSLHNSFPFNDSADFSQTMFYRNPMVGAIAFIVKHTLEVYSMHDFATEFCKLINVTGDYPTNYYLQMICEIVGTSDLFDVERKCLAAFVPGSSTNHETFNFFSIRPLTGSYRLAIAITAVKKVLNLREISGFELCGSLGDYFNLRRENLESLSRVFLGVFLGEILPIVANSCNDFASHFDGIPDIIQHILPVMISEVIPVFIGYDRFDELCLDLINSINTHGFIEESVIQNVSNSIISNFQSKAECMKLVDSFQPLLSSIGLPDLNSLLNQTTNFESVDSLCGTLVFFMNPPCYESFTVSMTPSAVTSDPYDGLTFIQTFPYRYGTYSVMDRSISVGTGTNLPVGSYSEVVNPAFIRYMIPSKRLSAKRLSEVGVYVHILRSQFNVNSEAIITTIAQSDDKITFTKVTQTVYPGDDITLSVARPPIVRNYIWRHNGKPSWRGKNSITLKSVTRQSAGIYEIHKKRRRSWAKHGIMRLIIYDCPKGLRNPPDCNVGSKLGSCQNVGVLRQEVDKCICTPGFYGDHCEH
ncbi:uncharacterized protein [Apostichopus japonicus]